MTHGYIDIFNKIERVYKSFLNVLEKDIEHFGFYDLNNAQALIIYHMGKENKTMPIGELMKSGYYLGSNVSYNIKQLGKNEYVDLSQSEYDKRSVNIMLSDKGQQVYEKIHSRFDELLNGMLKNLSKDKIERFFEVMDHFEDFLYRGRVR
jgi:DNA-binding MarR family transcriptional regulator